MPESMTIAPIAAYYDSWKDGIATYDESSARATLAPDLLFEGPVAGQVRGAEPFLGGLKQFVQLMRSFRLVQRVETANEAAVLYDCDFDGGVTMRFVEFFRVEDGRIQELRLLFDPATFNQVAAAAASA
jgi:ketosteroid isomerase-like protein